MCGILGIINSENSKEIFKEIFPKITFRGRDACGLYDGEKIKTYKKNNIEIPNKNSKIILAHTLHSMSKITPQPLKNKGILIANCEIYNWRELSKKFNLKAENDSKLLLLLIEKIGLKKAIKKIRGPYALAYLIENKIYLARDPIGEKPIYYKYENSSLIFSSSEEKDLKALNPRIILEYDINKKELKKTRNPIPEAKKENTKEILIESIKLQIPEKHKSALLLSGGLDSSLIAVIMKNQNVNFTPFTISIKDNIEGEKYDLNYAKNLCKTLNIKLQEIQIGEEEIIKYSKEIREILKTENYLQCSIALPANILMKKAGEQGFKAVFSGLGAEELYAGYQRHKTSKDPNLECRKGLNILWKRDLKRDELLAMHNGLELRLPFLDRKLISDSLAIPANEKINENLGKYNLRIIALELNLPKEIAMRKKVALQYGSGIDKLITRISKKMKIQKKDFFKKI